MTTYAVTVWAAGVCFMVAVVAAVLAVVWHDRESESQRWQREVERVLARVERERVSQCHRHRKHSGCVR